MEERLWEEVERGEGGVRRSSGVRIAERRSSSCSILRRRVRHIRAMRA